jgi:hypothetical protein
VRDRGGIRGPGEGRWGVDGGGEGGRRVGDLRWRDPTTARVGEEGQEWKMRFSLWAWGTTLFWSLTATFALRTIFEASHPALSSALSFPAALSQANVGPRGFTHLNVEAEG